MATTLRVPGLRAGMSRMAAAVVAIHGTARRHWAFAVLLFAAAVLRGLVVLAYRPSFFYYVDSYTYLQESNSFVPGAWRPFGYSFFLWLMHPLGSLSLVVGVQHLAGLALGLIIYVFLTRRGVPRLIATAVLVPVLLDPRTVVIEHYLLAETLFTCLTAGAALLLCWRAAPGWLVGALSGALFTAAALTRSAALALLAVPVLYLVMRRAWRSVAAFVAVAALCVGGYASWYHTTHGVYGFTGETGRFLYSRAATFVDCDKLDLTPDERRLCPAQPLDRRWPPDLYLWNAGSANMTMPEPRYDTVFSSFARKAIKAQPGDYLRSVAVDTLIFMRPDGGRVDAPGHSVARADCLADLWQIPAPGAKPACTGFWVYGTLDKATTGSAIYQHQSSLTRPLSLYSRYAQVPPTIVLLAVLFVLGLLLWPGRRASPRRALDSLLWASLGLGLVVVSVATSALDPRYAVPSMPLVMVAVAVAWPARADSVAEPVTRPGDSAAEPTSATAPTWA